MDIIPRLSAIGLTLGLVVGGSIGCADRVDEIDEVDIAPQLVTAGEALANAERLMEQAGVAIDFDDASQLENLQENLPNPNELKDPAVQENIEGAIGSLNEVFDVMGTTLPAEELVPFGAPAQGNLPQVSLSTSDEAMILVHLAYLTSLDAVSMLAQVGGDLFQIEYPASFDTGEVYEFVLNLDTSSMDPDEILARFGDEQRQAMLDAVMILTGGVVSAAGRRPDVDGNLHRRSGLFYLNLAAERIAENSAEVEDAIGELRDTVNKNLSLEILQELGAWGFTIESLPADLVNLVDGV
ncbi:hypothetical protein HN371_23890 [Candidatus Poribacteria bacterium]|jgi:hypothetical protein|nr:hypothetical protein [Candidatus Poribacteria bacterium]MBT5531657.1 hypothetical protein [Candidatus Poribacteria bacterium]MBT5709482.1 hypothetical protein [Candidatus Poribacteria bacterium]MBT7807172.1 hypothetical protein [Candidatus Poribacteria bacterium]